MNRKDLPKRWKVKLNEYLAGDSELLTRYFVLRSIEITFIDGSLIEFQSCFSIDAEELEERAVFTENCGCHIFKLSSVKNTTSNWLSWGNLKL